MRKVDPNKGVGQKVLQIALPFEQFDGESARDTASMSEADRGQSSCATTPAGEAEDRPSKRKRYSLYDKVFAMSNLRKAWEKVQANGGAPGCDGQTVEQFEQDLGVNLRALHEQLQQKTYRPRPVRRVEIAKEDGGTRLLGIPTVRDRIVQQALLQVLQPLFEPEFSDYSHGFRPNRGCPSALDVVDRAVRYGYEWIVDADIEKFFDTVDHELLLDAVNEVVADGSVLKLIRMFLESGVLVGDDHGWEHEPTQVGTPQGGPVSPLLANIYLHKLDVTVREAGFGLVRYADDFVIFTKAEQQAHEALAVVRRVAAELKLSLHPEKTHIATIDEGFSFLGYRYFRDSKGRQQKIVREKSVCKFRNRIRVRTPRHAGQTPRKASKCTVDRLKRNQQVQQMICDVNDYLRGWHWYFKDVATTWRNYFNDFDQFVRRRVRSAIAGRYAKGRWHHILGKRELAQLGLLSLEGLQTAYCNGLLNAPPGSG